MKAGMIIRQIAEKLKVDVESVLRAVNHQS